MRHLIASGRPPTISAIARRMEVSPQAASEMIARLRADGLVCHGDGRDLQLSDAGQQLAHAIFRRHALVEWLLADVIGMGWADADREARRLQGAISPAVEASLDAFLGYPSTCPHGNPISPDARPDPAAVPLSGLRSGTSATIQRVSEEAEGDSALLSYLEARGLRPGAEIVVRANSDSLEALTVDGPRGSAMLGLRPASQIMVLPEPR